MRTIILTFDEYLLINGDCINKYCKILKVVFTVLLSNDCSIANWGDIMSGSYWEMVSLKISWMVVTEFFLVFWVQSVRRNSSNV